MIDKLITGKPNLDKALRAWMKMFQQRLSYLNSLKKGQARSGVDYHGSEMDLLEELYKETE